MGRNSTIINDRARQLLAQEAARIIVDQGIQDYRIAKTKAAERLGLSDRGSLPGNAEIEGAVAEHLKLFGRESHLDLLHVMRRAAIAAMDLLTPFTPRLVGPVLHGTAAANSPINLHVFADDSATVAISLAESTVQIFADFGWARNRQDRDGEQDPQPDHRAGIRGGKKRAAHRADRADRKGRRYIGACHSSQRRELALR